MTSDSRHIANGRVIPTENYADQPYVVHTADGAWLCAVTTGPGREGEPGQHVVTRRSNDQGRTWSAPSDVEPSSEREASYAVLLAVPTGRIYCFYNYNADNLRQVIADDPPFAGGVCRRVDSLGQFVFKYSDDGGRSWSPHRHAIPAREMAIDRENAYSGRVRFFWNVGRPFVARGAGYVPLHIVGGFGAGFFTRSEGVLLRCANILTEDDPDRLIWETLPDGDHGLRAPSGGGPIAEEQSFSVLSDGSLFVVYRTVDGYPAYAYSRDGGHTWSPPRYMRFADGRRMKHPRAANFCWGRADGTYLYWFHNHGGPFVREAHDLDASAPYRGRNPAWLCAGIEFDSPEGKIIRWSQPEIALYADDASDRMSYPDLIEEGDALYVTETQKTVARVHRLSPDLIAGLANSLGASQVVRRGLILDLLTAADPLPAEIALPDLAGTPIDASGAPLPGASDLDSGFALNLAVTLGSLAPGQRLLDARDAAGIGWALVTSGRGTLRIVMNDGRTEDAWEYDSNLLQTGVEHHLAIIVDGGPRIVTMVVDGRLCDGGSERQYGWGRFSVDLHRVCQPALLRVAPELDGAVSRVRVYGRALRTWEALANWRADRASQPR